MRRVGILCVLGGLLAAGVAALIAGCIPYLEKPEADRWTKNNVGGHLAMAFSSEEHAYTGDEPETFSNSSGAVGYSMCRVMFNIQLAQGNARIEIRSGATLLVDTSGVTGNGPWGRFDLGFGLPGNLDVLITTNNALGMISVNIDEIDPADRIGFFYNRTFPDKFGDQPAALVPQEYYSWTPPVGLGTFTADLDMTASIYPAGRSSQIRIDDDADVEQHNTTFLSGVPNPQSVSTTVTGNSGTVGPPPIDGRWKIMIDHTNAGGDSALDIKLTIP